MYACSPALNIGEAWADQKQTSKGRDRVASSLTILWCRSNSFVTVAEKEHDLCVSIFLSPSSARSQIHRSFVLLRPSFEKSLQLLSRWVTVALRSLGPVKVAGWVAWSRRLSDFGVRRATEGSLLDSWKQNVCSRAIAVGSSKTTEGSWRAKR